MTNWDTQDAGITREEAIVAIKSLARDKGITGQFKVYYDGNIVSTTESLPESVDMTKIQISETLDQA